MARGLGAESELETASRLILNRDLAEVFTGLPEVELTGIWQGQRMIGSIDRLVLRPRPLIVDFKSNREVPTRPEDVPEGILRQMAAYRALVEQCLGPADCAVFWTATGALMDLPAAVLDATVSRLATPLSQEAVDLDLAPCILGSRPHSLENNHGRCHRCRELIHLRQGSPPV